MAVLKTAPAAFTDEAAFRTALASYLELMGHTVWAHDGPWPRRFRVAGGRKHGVGFVDLYVRTHPEWPHHREFPVIAVETKLAKNLGWLVDAFLQVNRYSAARSVTYVVDGEPSETPSIVLLATDHLMDYSVLYRWQMPSPPLVPPLSAREQQAGDMKLTELFDRMLWKHGGALLRGTYFLSNAVTHSGAKRYDLDQLGGDSWFDVRGRETWHGLD